MGRHLIEKIFMQVLHKVLFLDFFALIYINDLAENLSSNPNLFAGDTSLLSVALDMNISANKINDKLKKIEA